MTTVYMDNKMKQMYAKNQKFLARKTTKSPILVPVNGDKSPVGPARSSTILALKPKPLPNQLHNNMLNNIKQIHINELIKILKPTL